MRFSATAVAVLSVLSNGALAQSDIRDSAQTEVIVVTGQKIARSTQDTKESVAVVTDQDIERYELQDLNDIYAFSANVYDMGSGEVFGIRGVSQNSASTGGGTGEMGSLYIDGVAYTGYASRFLAKDVWDVEQVEVLRGPQSTNVGRNALIGAVVVESKKPELGYYDAVMRVGAGNYGRKVLDGMFNAPVGDDAALRVTGQFHESDGFMKNATLGNDDFDARENHNIRAQLLIEPSDQWSLNLMAQFAKSDRGQDIYYVNPANGYPLDSRTSYDDVVARENYDGFTAAIDFTYYLTEQWTLSSITSYLGGDYVRTDDSDRIPGVTGNQVDRTVEDKNIAQEVRFNFEGQDTRGVAGIYLTQVEQKIATDRLQLVGIHPLISAGLNQMGAGALEGAILPLYMENAQIDDSIAYDKTVKNMAFFTEWDHDIASAWTASAGFRYDYEKSEIAPSQQSRSVVGGLNLPDAAGAGAAIDSATGLPAGTGAAIVSSINNNLNSYVGVSNQAKQETSYHALLPQVGLTYNINQDASISTFYKRGYRSGGTDIDGTGTSRSFDPEHLDNFELAIRTAWLDGDLISNANIYYGDWKNQQVDVCPDGNSVNCYTENAGESEIYGLEFENIYLFNEDLSLFANVGFAKTKFKDYVGAQGDLSGNQFAFSPEYTGSLGANYFFTERVYSTFSVDYVDEMYGDQANNELYKSDARTIYNVTAGYLGDNFKVDAYVKNLTDEFYINGNYSDYLDNQNIRAGAPREFGANLTIYM
ncbi:TonB-dependent receptor [Vibrio kagoshimensis]|uniref:TonB-dependent receptor n=1 Tax=Vibrio kagoshimensis TaxID=2910244 RepID=UPI003D1E1B0E